MSLTIFVDHEVQMKLTHKNGMAPLLWLMMSENTYFGEVLKTWKNCNNSMPQRNSHSVANKESGIFPKWNLWYL